MTLTSRLLLRCDLRYFDRIAGITEILSPTSGLPAWLFAQTIPVVGLAESILGFEAFREGDDVRKIDPRLSDLLGSDVAREFEEPRLAPVDVLYDATRSVCASPRRARVGAAATISMSLGLARGGHSVNLNALPGGWLAAVAVDSSAGGLARMLERRDRINKKAALDRMISDEASASDARRRSCILITDAAWSLRQFKRFVRIASGRWRHIQIVIVVDEHEHDPSLGSTVVSPGGKRSVPAPADPTRATRRQLGQLTGVAVAGGADVVVLRFDDPASAVRFLCRRAQFLL